MHYQGNRKRLLIFAVAALSLPLEAQAQQTDEVVTVYGQTLPQSFQSDSLSNPYRLSASSSISSQTLNREQLQEIEARNIFELLDHLPGVNVQRRGRKQPYVIAVRGDKNFAYLIDGAYFNTAAASRVLQNLSVSDIEQLQIVRDASVLSLGPLTDIGSASNGALNSGFIVIRTRQASKRSLELNASAEHPEAYKAGVYLGSDHQFERMRGYANVSLNYSNQSDYKDWYDGSEYQNMLIGGGLSGERLSTSISAYIDEGSDRFQRADPDQAKDKLAYAKWRYDSLKTRMVALNSEMVWNPDHVSLLQMSYNKVSSLLIREYFAFPEGQEQPKAEDPKYSESMTYRIAARHSWKLGNHLLQAGGDYLHWESPYGELNYDGFAREEQVLGGFILGESALLDQQLMLDASVRLDSKYVKQGVDFISDKDKDKQSYRDRRLPNSLFYGAGASWNGLEGYLLNARYAFGRQGGVHDLPMVDNVDAEPMRQHRWELGIAADWGRYIQPRVTWFQRRIENDKQPVDYDEALLLTRFDQSQRRNSGTELMLDGQLSDNLCYDASWTYIYTQSQHWDRLLAGSYPEHMVNFALTQWWQDYQLRLQGRYVSDYYSNSNFAKDGEAHRVGDYWVVDTRLSRELELDPAVLNLSLYVMNLGDTQYQSQYAYADQGRRIGVEVSAAF
ncbi:TonB-dependent receptor plug domain-containing protein [Vibrio sp. WXL210]|uniref:TonB-dependent receptor plug domain-containing protein n=1 Tax=Vibrio sp. WXL210 TaxID=3450709 RepID=UPI003EC5D885